MADLTLTYGGDLAVAASGDLAVATGSALTGQRVLRRLRTSPGDYIWQLSYGAGLGRFVGMPGAAGQAMAVARAQLREEARVAVTPPPQISAVPAGVSGIAMTISYRDTVTGQSTALTLPG